MRPLVPAALLRVNIDSGGLISKLADVNVHNRQGAAAIATFTTQLFDIVRPWKDWSSSNRPSRCSRITSRALVRASSKVSPAGKQPEEIRQHDAVSVLGIARLDRNGISHKSELPPHCPLSNLVNSRWDRTVSRSLVVDRLLNPKPVHSDKRLWIVGLKD